MGRHDINDNNKRWDRMFSATGVAIKPFVWDQQMVSRLLHPPAIWRTGN
jgi:hypothetical protein